MSGKLVSLEDRHAQELETFLCEFDAKPNELHGYFCERDWPIDRAVHTLAAWGRGEELRGGRVPCSTWFWEDERALQGVINVRHYLTAKLEEWGGHIGYSVAPSHRNKGVATRMLAEVLAHCRGLEIARALLTCDAENTASRKTIETNGGIFDREAWSEPAKGTQRWYWIDLT